MMFSCGKGIAGGSRSFARRTSIRRCRIRAGARPANAATHELAFIATGLYGKPIPKQNGAPLRLTVPWKYGFKHIKSIVRFSFSDERPINFWQEIGAREYGFWANVNPEVPHPRWSQASERVLGKSERVPTLLYNGYGEFVADLYKGMDGEKLFM